MKKGILLASMIVLASLVFSCTEKNNDAEEIVSIKVGKQIDASGKEKNVDLIPCVLFYPKASLWTENSAGKLVSYTTLYVGQELYAFPALEGSESTEIEAHSMIKDGSSKATEIYAKVWFNDNPYYIDIDLIAINATPKVVIENGYNYNSDQMTASTKTKVSAGQIVASFNSYVKSEDSDLDCYNVTYRTKDNKSSKDVYLKTDIISEKSDDVIAQRYLNRLPEIIKNNEKNKDALNVILAEMYENCKELDLSNYYKNLINEAFASN